METARLILVVAAVGAGSFGMAFFVARWLLTALLGAMGVARV